jgi:P63C domain.
LLAPLISPIQFRPLHGGRTAYGYEATVLPRICEVILDATRGNAIRTATLAETAEVLLRGFAQVGIIALVDEATGYQDVRARDALAKILEAFVAKELRPWIKTFPPDFYKEMFRLRGMAYPPRVKKPRYVGLLTNNLVYARLAPGVLKELQERNPVLETGRRRHKHFQWLTEDLGHPKLKDHIVAITALMRASVNWQSFTELLERAFPKYKELPLYAAEIAEEEAQSEQEGAST